MTPIVEATGWALIHFVWQGAAIGIATAIALEFLARRSPRVRYATACLGLAAMLAAPVATVGWTPRLAVEPSLAERGTTASARVTTAGGYSGAPGMPDRSPRPLLAAAAARPLAVVVALWLTGVVVLIVRMAFGFLRISRLRREALRVPASGWQTACERLAARLGIRGVIHVIESAAADVPAVIGWATPVVILPVASLAGLAPAQVEAILAHELAHIRRHDYLVNLLQTFAETLLFYHPAVWWVSARIRAEREYCCDDLAVAVCGDAVGYASALAHLESSRARVPAPAVAASGGSLLDRIGRILRVPRSADTRSHGWIVTVSLTLLFTAAAGGLQWLPDRLVEAASDAVSLFASDARVVAADRPGIVVAAADRLQAAATTAIELPIPADGDDLSVRVSDDDYRVRWSSGFHSTDVKGSGDVDFTDDLRDVASLSPGGYLMVRDWTGWLPRTIEIRSEGGGLTRKYYVGGFERPWSAAVQQRLAGQLPALVRRSGLGARSRTRRILAARGVDGVFAEIDRLEADYARRLYFRELMAADRALDEKTLARTLMIAGRSLHSDYYLTETLRDMAPLAAASPAAAKAYVDALDSLTSDYDHRRAVLALLRAAPPASSVVDLALRSTGTMRSDYERAETLRAALQAGRAGEGEALFTALEGLKSDYEKRRVLSILIDRNADAGPRLLEAAATIDSDYECATLLLGYLKQHAVDEGNNVPFFNAVRTIDSNYERRRVLIAVVAGDRLGRDVIQSVLEATAEMTSDYERAETLLSVLRRQPIDSSVRDRFLDAVQSMRSDYDQGRVLVALVRAERR